MKKILLPTNFSQASESAYELTATIAKKTGATVTICNLIPTWTKGIHDYSLINEIPYIDELEDLQFEKSFKNMAEILKSPLFNDVKVEKEIKLMSPNDWKGEFINEVNESNYDLVILGHNESGKASTFFTEDLSQKLNTPVLACTQKSKIDDNKPVLVCTDFENVNASYFKMISKLTSSKETPKTIFYVNTKKDFLTDDEIQKEYKKLVNHYHLKNTTLKYVNEKSAVDAIKKEINKENYKIVTLATQGVSGLLKFFKKSVTEEIIENSLTPILSVNLHDFLEEKEGVRAHTGFTG